MRCAAWEQRLDRLLVAGAARPFEWGRWDCCLFVADALLAVTGQDLAVDLRSRYSSLREARWLLRARYGSASIEKAIMHLFDAARLRPTAPGLARRGDPVIARDGHDIQIGVIGLGGKVVINTERNGLVRVPRSLVTRAWNA
jgi:hypothetical protein